MNQQKSPVSGIIITLLLLFSFIVVAVPSFAVTKEQIEQQQVDISKMADETLARLYKTQPSAEKAIKKAAGYAVFSNFGMKILFAGAARAKV